MVDQTKMNRIFFCGDPHGRFAHIVDAVKAHRPTAVVLLGDLQAQRPLEQEFASILTMTEVWWIHGNHDTDSDADYDNLFGSALIDRNLHGRIVDVAGMRIAGLGGVFRGQVWMPPAPEKFETPASYMAHCGKGNLWRGGLSRKHRSSIFSVDYQRLIGEQADILVTHEAPSCHSHGFLAIDELARNLRVRRAFHGHHHVPVDYGDQAERLGFAAYGVGYRGIVDQDGNVIHTEENEAA